MRLGNFTLQGHSLGGVETAVWIPELRLAFDVGRGRAELLRCDHLALTHAHLDHIGGLPYLLALRQLFRKAAPTIYAPAQIVDALEAMLTAWEPLQRYPMRCPIVAVEPGSRHPLRRDIDLVAFRTYHPVPSCGYTVVQKVDKLLPELIGRPGREIAALRAAGERVTRTHERALLSVTGDTLARVLDKQPHILESEVLLLECTFLDASKPLVDAHAGGHVHLDDLWPYADAFANDALILSHFSQLHGVADIDRLLAPFAARVRPALHALGTEPGDAIRPISASAPEAAE